MLDAKYISGICGRFKREENMTIAGKIRESQDVKEMTRRAIQILEKSGQNVEELKAEFLEIYNEKL